MSIGPIRQPLYMNEKEACTLDVVFHQIEIILKDSTAVVYVTKSEKSSHFTLMT